MSKHIELARKLKALAEKGVGGEKANAERMLSEFLQRHDLSEQDLEDEVVNRYFLNMTDDTGKLWIQVIRRVNRSIPIYGKYTAKIIKELRLTGNYMIKCTVAEYVEIEVMYETYSRLLKKEYEVFFRAFCTANDLLIAAGPDDNKATPEELAEQRRANQMASTIKSETHRKQLEK